MTDPLEQELRAALTRAAGQAPSADGVVGRVQEHVRRRARVRAALVLAAVLPLAALGAGVAASVSSGSGDGAPDVSAQPVITGTGAVEFDSDANSMCIPYDLEDFPPQLASTPDLPVEDVWFALDGTVTDIGPGRDTVRVKMVTVAFDVHEWFAGGAERTIIVELPDPGPADGFQDDYSPPHFDIGTRLLVSGARGWSDGSFGEDARGGGCGFTRYYDEPTADAWREVLEPLR